MKIWRVIPDTNSKYTDVVPTDDFFNNDDLQNHWYHEIGKQPEGQNYIPIEMKKNIKVRFYLIYLIFFIEL